MNKAPRSVLLVTPHQDDAEGGCGGSVGLWTKQGAKAVYVLCTNGDKGSSDPAMTSPALASHSGERAAQRSEGTRRRKRSLLAAPRRRSWRTLWSFAPRWSEKSGVTSRRRSCASTPSEPPLTLTGTIRVSGMVALDAVFTYAWSPHQFPEQISEEGLEPHQVSEIYMWGSERPDTYVDISDTVDAKALSSEQTREPDEGAGATAGANAAEGAEYRQAGWFAVRGGFPAHRAKHKDASLGRVLV